MPQVFALVIAGAGLYAGFKWVSRVMAGAQDAARRAEAAHRDAMAQRGRGAPKDLGTRVYDAVARVYRTRGK